MTKLWKKKFNDTIVKETKNIFVHLRWMQKTDPSSKHIIYPIVSYCCCISLFSLSLSSCNVMSRALSCFRKPWLGRMQRRCRTCSTASTTVKLCFIIRYANTRVADLLRPITQCTSTLSRKTWSKDKRINWKQWSIQEYFPENENGLKELNIRLRKAVTLLKEVQSVSCYAHTHTQFL